VGTFTWRGKTTPIAIRVHQDGLLLQRLYFADEVQNAAEIDRGAEPKIRDQERTLAERLVSELSGTEFQPENYEDEYRKRLLKAIEQKIAGQEIERVEVEARPPTTDLVATLKASLGRKGLAKVPSSKSEQEAAPAKRPVRRRRASERGSDSRALGVLQRPQLPVPAHVVRAKARLMLRLMLRLVEELTVVVATVGQYREAIDAFFADLPGAQWIRTLPIGEHGVTAPSLWARLGDAPGRWESFQHLQGHAGAVPVTIKSGHQRVVHFRFACDKALRDLVDQVAFLSLGKCEWARAYYDQQRARGHGHHSALRALGAKWLKITFVMWQRHIPYDEQHHLATMARHQLRQRPKKIA
jgi:hypothetical protein